MPITVATWNVQWQFGDWRARQPLIRDTLAGLGAGVVALQETWRSQIDELADSLELHQVWSGHVPVPKDDAEPAEDRSMGNAILSRWPIVASDFRFLEDAAGRRYRTILGATIATPHGVLPVFTTHLDHRFDRSATRMSQLDLASRFIESHVESHAADDALPPLLLGDLNAVPDSDEIRRLTGRSSPYVEGRIWSDAWEQVGEGPGITWSLDNPYIEHSAWPNRRLDYVLIGWPRPQRPTGNPQRARLFGTDPVDGLVGSDHYGVAVDIHIAAGKMER